MKTRTTSRLLALSVLLAAGACDDLGTAPAAEEDLTFEDQIALQVLQNPLAVEAALDLASGTPSSSPWHGMGRGMARSQPSAAAQQARVHFDAALQAMAAGEMTEAAHEARQARELVARGMRRLHGDDAVSAMVERMEDLSVTAATDPGRLNDAAALGLQLEMLASSARASMGRGNLDHAASLGVLGEQRIAQCSGLGPLAGDSTATGLGYGMGNGAGQGNGTGMGGRGMGMGNGGMGMGNGGMGTGNGYGMGDSTGLGNGMGYGAGQTGWMHGGTLQNTELVVGLGETALALATGLLQDSGADEEQQGYLDSAAGTLALAQEALLAGELNRAHYLAGLVQWQALKAVVLPGGVTDEEIQAMLTLAQQLFADAVAAVGDAPTELQADLLARAEAMIEMSLSHLESWGSTGVNPLWRAAVISAPLVATAG